MTKACVMWLAVLIAGIGNAMAETLVERGSYLVNTIMACGNCHTPKDASGQPMSGKELSGGGLTFNTPGFTATASNITPDRETGIGAWSDADIRRALTEGIRPGHVALGGVPLAPPMPSVFYKALTTRDLDAVVAYLRAVPPIRNMVPAPVYKMPVKYVPYPGAEQPYSEDALKDPVKRGAYLVTAGHCMICHTPFVNGVPDYKGAFGKGGRAFGPPGDIGFPNTWDGSVSRNITAHEKSGLGSWSDIEIKRAITRGISRDGRVLKPPMAFGWYAHLDDADLDAIVAWLRTLPPLE